VVKWTNKLLVVSDVTFDPYEQLRVEKLLHALYFIAPALTGLSTDCPAYATIRNVSDTQTYICSVASTSVPVISWIENVTDPTFSSRTASGSTYSVLPNIPGNHVLTCIASVSTAEITCPDVTANITFTVVGKSWHHGFCSRRKGTVISVILRSNSIATLGAETIRLRGKLGSKTFSNLVVRISWMQWLNCNYRL
jgi:hypothetical protein